MEFLSEAIVSTPVTGASATNNRGSPVQFLIGVIIAMAVLRLEVRRRAADMPQLASRPNDKGYVAGCLKVLWLYAPETVGLCACAALSVHLRANFSADGIANPEVWAQIAKDWPILLTADTLLAVQAMLRVLVLISTVVRAKAGSVPLSGESALLFCGAALGRAVLASRSRAYLIDGPLGGYLPVACELASVPLFAILSRSVCKGTLAAAVLTLAVAARLAFRNHLALADGDTWSDALFAFAHLAELLAAFAYLSRTLLLDTSRVCAGKAAVALHFAYFIMPLQQCLAAYYFVQAFHYEPSLVGAGHPFEILQIGGVAQLGAYACAAVLHFVECLEAPVDEGAHHSPELYGDANGATADAAPQHTAVRAA